MIQKIQTALNFNKKKIQNFPKNRLKRNAKKPFTLSLSNFGSRTFN